MLKGLYTAYTGMLNEQHRLDTLTNNLANASTVGFKKEGATSESFRDVLTVKIKDTSTNSYMNERIGRANPGVKIGENYTNYTQGSFRITDNTYDLALAGEGFFAIEFTNKAGETSTMYTRGGQFTLNRDGYLVTEDGDYVLDTQSRRIRVDTLQDAKIADDGTITQNDVAVARIGLVDFEDYDYLEKYGETYYRPVEGARTTPATALIKSGYLEMSNVQVVSEMVNLIAITRAYESNQKIIQTYDSSLEIAATQLGRV
ncbi:MAG: flagellar hook-basal body protein [Lachnospiraceae bacterium]|jgi:flagellar basal-body rod protein FlgG|uniref:flagellar hook-basal body protein n=1 Tax=uncultured Acetatifactor sp. TaxID=1671927 RepID=UPI00260655F0|nr:flagellar hook-basal body protein [uncultured Acetatifactor sp.]MCI8790744.1 flagellar hook-basal body protein [Lachnospiraceae bacterium]